MSFFVFNVNKEYKENKRVIAKKRVLKILEIDSICQICFISVIWKKKEPTKSINMKKEFSFSLKFVSNIY